MDSNAAQDIQGNPERKKKSWNRNEKGDRETARKNRRCSCPCRCLSQRQACPGLINRNILGTRRKPDVISILRNPERLEWRTKAQARENGKIRGEGEAGDSLQMKQ